MNIYDEQNSKQRLSPLTDWKFNNDGIEKNYLFKDFREAMAFMIGASLICESKNHHPEWKNVYNKLHVRFSTHDAGGVTDKDFDLAESFEKLFSQGY